MQELTLATQHSFKFNASKKDGVIALAVELEAFYEAHNYYHADQLELELTDKGGESCDDLAEEFMFLMHKKRPEWLPEVVFGAPFLVALKKELSTLDSAQMIVDKIVNGMQTMSFELPKPLKTYSFELGNPDKIFLLFAHILGGFRENKRKYFGAVRRVSEHQFEIETTLKQEVLSFILDGFLHEEKPGATLFLK